MDVDKLIILNKYRAISDRLLYSSTALLFILLLVKLTATLFAIFVYAKVTPLIDAELYLNTDLKPFNFSLLFNRTLFTGFIYATYNFI